MVEIVELNMRMSDKTDPQLIFNTRSGGPGIDGAEQILSPLSERWRFRAVFPVINATAARTIRRAKAKAQGRFNYIRLRICDQYRISRRDIQAIPPVGDGVPHSDGAYFSDGTGYALAQPRAPITAVAAANASEISVRASDFAGAMVAGVFFSINYKLYLVEDWELVGDSYVLQISPPLRAAVTPDDEADFDAVCDWRLESDNEGELTLRAGRFGEVTLNLLEPIG